MSDALTIKNVSIAFSGQYAVKDVTFSLEKGDIAALIGPNGSGKSTLLKAILGLVPYQGEIRIFNKKAKQAFSQIGYVPQRFHFDRNFPVTVHEFMLLSPARNVRIRPDHALEEVGMLSYRHQVLGKLSGGQLQRVLIAYAMLNDPDLLILDEPTSGIDADGVEDFYALIEHVNQSHNTTVLMVSHEVYEVQQYARTVLCLNRDLVCEGDPKKVLTPEVLRRLYGSVPSVYPGTHNDFH